MPSMAAMAIKALSFHLSFLLLFLPLISGDDGTQFMYNGFNGANLELRGSASVHSNGLLQLNNNPNPVHTIGSAFHRNPVKFDQSRSFSAAFVFAIHPSVNLWGQGMTMVLSPTMDFDHASPDEYLGLFNPQNNGNASNHVFAVELDTNQNAAFGDINSNHVGIDVNGLMSISSAPATYYSSKEGKNESLLLSGYKIMQIWIDYDEHEMLVNVTLAPIEVSKPNRRLLSTGFNLSKVLLDEMYVGFTSSTTFTQCDHFVLGWSWNQTGPAQSLDPSKLPSIPKYKTKGKSSSKIFIPLLITTLFVVLVLLASAYVIWRKKYEEVREPWEEEHGPCRFSYKDLYKATKGFRESGFLGKGGYGKVYKGELPGRDGAQVAVKRVSHETDQGVRAFVAEVVSMRRLRHRNLVQLLGYCRRKGELLLVYEFMANGSLDKFLFGNEKPTLGWQQRFKIIKEVASAILYLHEESIQVVLHRDVKASNVMLDECMSAKLGDFGLARLYDHGTNPRTTHVVGTAGYLAPEFARTGKATTGSDVFSFGAFLLEVACGRSLLEADDQGCSKAEEEDLVEWVFSRWKNGLILTTCDPKLSGNYNPEEMELVLKMGLLCSNPNPEARPSMRQVVQVLDGLMVLPDIPPDFVGLGGVFMKGNDSGTSSSFPSMNSQGEQLVSLSSFDSILQHGR